MASNDHRASASDETREIEPPPASARRAWDSPSLKVMTASSAELGVGTHPDAEGTS